MTRKHFIALAGALAAKKPPEDSDTSVIETWENCVTAVADVCSRFNYNFKRFTFYDACNIEIYPK